MEPLQPAVVTLSRQWGRGGSYWGLRLADRLGFKWVDREILQRAAAQMRAEPQAVAHLDEHLSSFGASLLN